MAPVGIRHHGEVGVGNSEACLNQGVGPAFLAFPAWHLHDDGPIDAAKQKADLADLLIQHSGSDDPVWLQ